MSDSHIPDRPPAAHKLAQVAALRERLAQHKSFLLTDYRGLSVGEKQRLTRQLRETGAGYSVVKNRLLKLALGEDGETLAEQLDGPTAVVFLPDDPVAPTKTLFEFMQRAGKVTIKAGYIRGQLYSAEQVEALSKLPSRDELIAQVVAGIGAPLTGLVYTLQGVLNQFVWTLQALVEQREQAEA